MLVLTVELWWIHWRNCRISRSIKVGLLFWLSDLHQEHFDGMPVPPANICVFSQLFKTSNIWDKGMLCKTKAC